MKKKLLISGSVLCGFIAVAVCLSLFFSEEPMKEYNADETAWCSDFMSPIELLKVMKKAQEDIKKAREGADITELSIFSSTNAAPVCDLKGKPINGWVNYYHENGNLSSRVTYKKGLMQFSMDYDQNGILVREVPYKNGDWDGVVKFYWEDGSLKTESFYVNGELKNEKDYYDDVLHLESEYDGDKRHDKVYREDGSLEFEEFYDGFNLIERYYYDEDGNKHKQD